MPNTPAILSAVVNHNTSAFTELMLRSLFAAHPALPNFSLRVFDNATTDVAQLSHKQLTIAEEEQSILIRVV